MMRKTTRPTVRKDRPPLKIRTGLRAGLGGGQEFGYHESGGSG